MKRLFVCAAFAALIVSTAEGGNVATVDIDNFAVDDGGNPTQFVLSVKAPTDMSPVLYAGYGMSDGGSDTNAWDNFEFIHLFNVSVGQGLDPAKFTGEIRRYVVTTDGGTVTNQHLVAARARRVEDRNV